MPDAIADTSSLQYLHQIGCLRLLADLYGQVIVPRAVALELQEGMQLGFNIPDVTQLPWALVEVATAVLDNRILQKFGAGRAGCPRLGVKDR